MFAGDTNEGYKIEEILDYFLSHKGNLGRISMTEGRDVLQLASHVVQYKDIELKNKGLELLYDCCFTLKDIELKELWNIYWLLNLTLFADSNARIEGTLDELYRFIFFKVRSCVAGKYERIEHTNSNLIIVTTDQFLGAGHAPTRRVMDYAYTIATTMKKEVMIVNDTGMHYAFYSWLEQERQPNYLADYENMQAIVYKGVRIPYMQICALMPDLKSINEMLRQIYQLQPELVYNIGGSSLLSDLCTIFTKTACFPCSTDIPITMSEYLLVGRALNKNDEKRLGRLESYQKVIETIVNYNFRAGKLEYKRSYFGILEDDFVIGIIGNRLDSDMSDEFILLMDKILMKQKAHFLIIGEVKDVERIKKGVSQSENLHFTGSPRQAALIMKLCDIYCNPRRNGGGRSSFEALVQGVPVITLKYGDVYYTCGEEFAVDTYDDFLERINRYVIDKEFLEMARKKAVERASVLSDLPGTQRKILEQIL